MAGHALKSPVVDQHASEGPPPRTLFQLAGASDDADLRAMERSTPIPGWVSLSYEREPSYFLGETIAGVRAQTYVARDPKTGKLVCKFGQSFRTVYLNGEQERLGYLSQLRLDARYTGKARVMKEGFDLCRDALSAESDLPYFLTSVISSNERARRNLTAKLPGKPSYRDLTTLSTLALPCNAHRSPKPIAGVSIERGSKRHLDAIVDCLQRNYRTYQFAPCWTADDLTSATRCRGLKPEDFLIAVTSGEVVGCLALWDQSSFKQYVVRGYNEWLAALRPLINVGAKLGGYTILPKAGEPLRGVYLSHVAVDGNDYEILLALVQRAREQARLRDFAFAMIGFAHENPLLAAVKTTFKHAEYCSQLYLVHWDNALSAIESLDKRPVHVEIATL